MPSLLDYLSPDLTLPEQYFAQQANDDGMGPEKALMYAVLKDGIRCFYKYTGSTRRKYRKMSDEAEEWLMDDCWDDPFSFTVICDTLGIDPACLRAKLLAWKDTELERRRMTGDTKSIQVGRSPFPVAADDIEVDPSEMSFNFYETTDDAETPEPAQLTDFVEASEPALVECLEEASKEPEQPVGWADFEHLSFEELHMEERLA